MFDLNILCVGQENPTINIPGNKNIWIHNTNDDWKQKVKYYYQIAPLMSYIDGIWYELLCSEDEIGGTIICDYAKNIGKYPYWVFSRKIRNNLDALLINDEYYESFREIIIYLIGQSPLRRVILFCRYQSSDEEVFCGTLRIENFFKLLDARKILTNVCYSITDTPNVDFEHLGKP